MIGLRSGVSYAQSSPVQTIVQLVGFLTIG